MADGQGGILGIDLNGCCVEIDAGLAPGQQEANDAARAPELEPDPRRVFADSEWVRLALNLDAAIEQAERYASSLGSGERALGCGEARVGSLGAKQVGRTHGG